MAAGYSRRLSVFGAASVLLLTLVGVEPGATARDQSAVAGPALAGGTFSGRSTIPHLSQRLAALAANPVDSIRAQARVTATPESGPGSLLRQHGTDRLLVDIRVARWDATVITHLQAAGARVVHRDAALRTVTTAVVPSALLALSRVRGVQYMSDIAAPQVSAVCDSTISEGDTILHAVQERTNAAVDGTGVTVGILSDSFDKRVSAATHAADDVASDNLPGSTNTCGHKTPVNVLHDFSDQANDQEDEGRAMAQIVHDLAPGAKILFATADDGINAFAHNIRALAKAGANIIVDDVSYFDEPFYQDGVIAKAVNDVRAAGVDYFSSAANNNIIIGGHDVASYEAVDGYRATTCPLSISTDPNLHYTDCHNFNGAGGTADPTYGFTVAANQQVNMVLDWAEPQFGVKTDYGLCVMSGTTLLGCADDRNPGANGTQLADEVAFASSGSSTVNFSVVVTRYGGNIPNTNATPRFKLTFLTNGSGAVTNVEYATPTGTDIIGPTIFGHNGTSGAVSTAASDVRVSPSTVHSYSSRGPVTLLFGPVVGTTPAALLATPQVLAKPDITASDCAINTFFGGGNRFCGTSAAAPHAAAVAALLLQQNPFLTPDQLNAALVSTAADLSLPAAVQGAGLIDAAAAGASVPKAQKITFAQPAKGAVGGSRTLSATASTGLPVTFTVSTAATHPAGACTVSGANGATVKYLKAGSCVINADQPGNGLYPPAARVSRTIAVSAAPSVTTKSLPSGVVGKKYAATLAAKGGNSPRTWRVANGKLPAGLSLAKSGAISGTPSKAGTFHVTVAVTDSSTPKVSASKQLTITIAPVAVRTTGLPSGAVGKKYSAKLAAYGGKAPLAWTLTSGKLPTGLSLSRSGVVSGKPSKTGTYHFTVRVADSAHKTASKSLTIVVKAR